MRLHYLDWGNDGAPPLQLISWDPYAAYAMADFVYDIAQLVRPTRTAPVRIVAHSLGGNVALHYADIFPDEVVRMVSIEG